MAGQQWLKPLTSSTRWTFHPLHFSASSGPLTISDAVYLRLLPMSSPFPPSLHIQPPLVPPESFGLSCSPQCAMDFDALCPKATSKNDLGRLIEEALATSLPAALHAALPLRWASESTSLHETMSAAGVLAQQDRQLAVRDTATLEGSSHGMDLLEGCGVSEDGQWRWDDKPNGTPAGYVCDKVGNSGMAKKQPKEAHKHSGKWKHLNMLHRKRHIYRYAFAIQGVDYHKLRHLKWGEVNFDTYPGEWNDDLK
eukprot:GHVS01076758.1.p1 GENE.GHVS01076758.1~~GHVS01076758.1.p1  ORF type:complete len:253 (-),score=42.14 GHVS01076758.1:213-971(-)